MTGVSLGKKLLRNVIRHTDIHNKLQEESDMWKLRGLEKHVLQTDTSSHRPASASRGYMHCERYEDDSSPSWDKREARGRLLEGRERSRLSDRDEREARYWTRKLYNFEANDPDRWGHSGFKELYPEEFKSDSGEENSAGENVRHRKKKCKSSREAEHRKHSRKSSKKRKRKKKRKKESKKRRADASDSTSDSRGTDGETRRKRRKEGKRKERGKRAEERRRGEEESSSEESDSEEERERRPAGRGKRRRRNSDSHHQELPRKKRKNWKTADEEKSEGSSDD